MLKLPAGNWDTQVLYLLSAVHTLVRGWAPFGWMMSAVEEMRAVSATVLTETGDHYDLVYMERMQE
jgi:hypothetical protein